MAYNKIANNADDTKVHSTPSLGSINKIALITERKLLEFLRSNENTDTFKLKWKYELFRYKAYKSEEKLMLDELKGEKSLKALRKDGRWYLMATRTASFLMHFSAMHKIDLFDRLKDFEQMASYAKEFSRNFHNEILEACGLSKNAENVHNAREGMLADKEIELNKRFEIQYGKIDIREEILLRKDLP